MELSFAAKAWPPQLTLTVKTAPKPGPEPEPEQTTTEAVVTQTVGFAQALYEEEERIE